MSEDFKNMGHKNLELLRYYISRDINEINKNIQKNNIEFIGYFIASLVDIFIVMIFNQYIDNQPIYNKIFAVIGLIFLFLISAKIITKFFQVIDTKRKESWRDKYLPEEILQIIDQFDNIACDGLLICDYYIKKYKSTTEDYIKKFYLYEIIHHLYKTAIIFAKIHEEPSLYVNDQNIKLLDSYRINNFIDFSKEINSFLSTEIPNPSGITSLDNNLKNLNSIILSWRYIQ